MPPHCLIIGTSNTLRRAGYPVFLAGLHPGLTFTVEGFGATPSVLLPYILAARDLADVTHVAIDTLVNDASHSAASPEVAAPCEAMLFETLDAIAASGRVPILLLLPQTNAVRSAATLHARRLAFVRARGYAFVDAVGTAASLAGQPGLESAPLHDDAQHMAWPLALLVAQRLATLVHAHPAAAQRTPLRLPYFRLEVPQGPEGRVQRATSLAERSYTPLPEGDGVTIELDAPATLMGLSLNAVRSSGAIEITSEDGQRMETCRALAGGMGGKGDRAMVHVVHPLAAPLSGRRFRLRNVPAAEGHGPVELEDAVFRQGTEWADPAGWAALLADGEPAAEPAPPGLDALDEAVAAGIAASLRAAERGGEPLARGPGAGGTEARRTLRRLVVGARPWERPPLQQAILLAQLAESMGEEALARRLLATARDLDPEHPDLDAAFRRLDARVRAHRSAAPTEA